VNNQPMTILGNQKYMPRGYKAKVYEFDLARQSGMYVLGRQGGGKSSFLESLIYQDIVKGYSVFVIDPAYDLINHVIAQLPQNRVSDTYLLDLEDLDYPFGLNLFDVPQSMRTDAVGLLMAVERVKHVFEVLFPGESRMMLDKILRFITLTLFDNPGTTLSDIPRLLVDDEYRARLVRNVNNYHARFYWEYEYNGMSPSTRRRETQTLSNRIPSLLSIPPLENIVAQKTTTIDFRRSIDNREIVLIRLPHKKFKEIASNVGTILIAELYRATFSYSDTALEDRPGFSLYVDEFQNFPSKDFAELFAEGRKFGIRMCVSHQRRDQLDEENRNATRSAGTLVCFTATSDLDARSMASAFVDQNATIRPSEAVRDVLKHLSDHPSEAVQSFLHRYIETWRAKSKEAITLPLPASLPRFENYASLLAFLERMMYLAQTDGFFTDDNWQSPLKKMLFDFEYICSRLLGFSDYYVAHSHKNDSKRKGIEDAATAKIAKLEAELVQKNAVLENETDFLGLFVGKSQGSKYSKEDWQKERSLLCKRQGVLELLRLMLSFASYRGGRKHQIDATALLGGDVSQVRERLKAIAIENARLCAYDTPEKICELRLYCVAGHLAQLEQERAERLGTFCEMIGWRSSTSPIQYEGEKPHVDHCNCFELCKHLKTSRRTIWLNIIPSDEKQNGLYLCRDIARLDERIYELKKDPLQARLLSGRPFEPSSLKAIAEFCKFLSTLNTPGKMLDALKQEYDKTHLEPLRSEIGKIQEGTKAELTAFDSQLEREKPVCEAFINGLWDCLDKLSINPIVEKKPLTSSDVAQILEQLPKRHALVRTSKADPNDEHEPTVFLITTLDVPESVEQSVFDARLVDIRNRTRAKYCRPRVEVEKELYEQKDVDQPGHDDNASYDVTDTDDLDRFDDDD
jgi:hypothetical protein